MYTQDVCGSTDSATQRVLLPGMPDFSGDDSNNSSSEDEDRVQFEKRQAGKFGIHSVGVRIGIRKGVAGKHIDSANIIGSPRKRKATVVHNVEGHSGDEGYGVNWMTLTLVVSLRQQWVNRPAVWRVV